MIDAKKEPLISLRKAASLPLLKVDGKEPHFSTIFRWTSTGARTANGKRVKLEVIHTPRGQCTTVAAVERFLSALNDTQSSPGVPSQNRILAIRRAEQELRDAGIA